MSRLYGERVATRDTRVRVYRYADQGTGGVIKERYVFAREEWAAFVPAGGIEQQTAQVPQSDNTAVFLFSEAVTILATDVLVVEGAKYRVTSVPDVRTRVPGRQRRVVGVRADKDRITLSES